MNNPIKLKSLASISFLIFLLPFLRTCSDKSIESLQRNQAVEVVEFDSINVSKKYVSSQEEIKKFEKERNERIINTQKENTFNFYELIYKTIGEKELKEYNKSTFEDKTFYPLFGFLLILINSILLLIFTFINKHNLTHQIGVLNVGILILSTFGLIFSEIVEDINQFKIGYYLFTLNSILIIIIAKKEKKKKNKETTASKGLAIAGGKYKFTFCASIEICILVESFSFDLPAIAKPRNGDAKI